ncbi:1950_t:CDS:2, partial [Dentiscutata erythropus]
TYPEPEKPDDKSAKESIVEPSTRTRFQTFKASSDSRAKTKEGQRDRQREYRASLRYCSLDEYQKEVKDNTPLQAPSPEIYYLLTKKDPISKSDYYHQISLALPEQEGIPKFSQIYFYNSSDIEAQIDRRHNVMKQSLNRDMITKEIAAICFSNENMYIRDILIVRHDNELEKISELHCAYDFLAYFLLFLYREYASKISKAEAEASSTSNIDFDTLLERELQSQTGLSRILKSATIRSSSSMMCLDNENIDTSNKKYLESRSSEHNNRRSAIIKDHKSGARNEKEE